MNEFVLDSTDLDILRCLQENARLTTKELAARVNLSTTPVWNAAASSRSTSPSWMRRNCTWALWSSAPSNSSR